MTNKTPDTDPLKREPPGQISRIPDHGPGEAGHPPASPDERGFPHTGDKHRPELDESDPASTETPQEENRPDNQKK